MVFLPLSTMSFFGLGLAAHLVMLTSASDDQTRNMYTIRSPGDPRRRAVEIIDLGTFLLTNSEDGRPKSMAPFYLNVFETREELSEEALESAEEATSDFLMMELNSKFLRNPVATVRTRIVSQERFVEELDDRKLSQGVRGRNLRSVPGSKFEVNVNVTFDREPSPDAVEVDQSLQQAMKDLTHLVKNMTATEDPELAYVFMAYREEIGSSTEKEPPAVETPTNPTTTTTAGIIKPVQPNQGGQSMKFIIPIMVALVLAGAIIALFVVRRKRRRVQAANQKVQEDLAFLDEETNVFSYENSPTKSSARTKRAFGVASPDDYDGDESSRYSTSQGSTGPTSPSYGMTSGIGSPQRSSLSMASTVKASNATLMPLPSKLTELASTSLFAFSEEDEEYDSSVAGNSQRTPVSLQKSVASNDASFNRLMNGDEEGISSIENSPRHSVTSPASTKNSTTTDQQDSPSKSTIASFISSHFFGGDSVSQFAGSALTVQAANTTEALQKKAATKNVRSFSLSPKKVKQVVSPTASVKSRAKSEAGGDDEDSVFDFLAVSPKPVVNIGAVKTPEPQDVDGLDIESLNEALEDTSVDVDRSVATTDASPAVASLAFASLAAASKANNTSLVSDQGKGSSNSGTPQSQAKSAGGKPPTSPTSRASQSPAKAAGGNPPSSPGTPQSQVEAVTGYDEDMSVDDSLSLSDAPGSFPRRSRRHAKSTTHDGTTAYQTNAMQPQDWSMTDGFSDDETLSEQGGGAAFGAFPKSGFRSPKSAQKKVGGVKSPSNQSKSSYSVATENSAASKEEDASQASASRQLINDLVWLSKKIAGVKQSAVESAPGEASALGHPPMIEPVDSLSYASQDGLISPTGHPDTESKQRTPLPQTPVNGSTTNATPGSAAVNTSIVCRDCYAPPGKLNIVIHSTKDGPAVHEVKDDSCLQGRIYPGDLIISVDDTDTRAFTAAQLMKMMAEKGQYERKITVLHFEETGDPAEKDT